MAKRIILIWFDIQRDDTTFTHSSNEDDVALQPPSNVEFI